MKKAMLALTFILFSHAAFADDLGVAAPWVRLVPPVAHASAAYMTLHNATASDISVITVTCDAAARSEMHSMSMRDGKMVMRHLDSVLVPAHGKFSFSPGHAHIMLMGLSGPLKTGQRVNIVLHLADGHSIPVQAPVRDMRLGK